MRFKQANRPSVAAAQVRTPQPGLVVPAMSRGEAHQHVPIVQTDSNESLAGSQGKRPVRRQADAPQPGAAL